MREIKRGFEKISVRGSVNGDSVINFEFRDRFNIATRLFQLLSTIAYLYYNTELVVTKKNLLMV